MEQSDGAPLQSERDSGPSTSPATATGLTRRQVIVDGALVAVGLVAGAGAVLVMSPGAGPTPPSGSAVQSPSDAVPASPTSAGASATTSSQPLPSAPPGLVATPPDASPEPIESAPERGPRRVPRENERRGSTAWELPVHGKGDAEVYASDASVAAGERIEFRISARQATGNVTLYRLGWYGGRGARVVARWRNVPLLLQPAPTTDPLIGLIRAPWSPTVTATVPDGWVSGLYLLVVSPAGASPQYGTFVVREVQPEAPILFVSSTTTHQAYNHWGGKSLYPANSTGAHTIAGDTNAVVASWDRPYATYRGGGLVLRWEYPFVRWLESQGYDVAYATDLDLARHPELASDRRLIVFAGHPEYWSREMRTTLENAIAAGTNVAFFSANEIYWQVRFDPAIAGAYRTVTCYRRAAIDPMAAVDPSLTTVRWREAPASRPESAVIGQMYGHVVLTPAAFVCSAPDHWIYAGTGMVAGDTIADLIGQEYDRFWPAPQPSPTGVQILAASPVQPNLGHDPEIYGDAGPDDPQAPVHNATIYTAASGATVFSAGTMQWSWGLDDWGNQDYEGVRTPVDARVSRITANILDRLGR